MWARLGDSPPKNRLRCVTSETYVIQDTVASPLSDYVLCRTSATVLQGHTISPGEEVNLSSKSSANVPVK